MDQHDLGEMSWEFFQGTLRPERLFRVVHSRTKLGRTVSFSEYFTDPDQVSERLAWISEQPGYTLISVDEYQRVNA